MCCSRIFGCLWLSCSSAGNSVILKVLKEEAAYCLLFLSPHQAEANEGSLGVCVCVCVFAGLFVLCINLSATHSRWEIFEQAKKDISCVNSCCCCCCCYCCCCYCCCCCIVFRVEQFFIIFYCLLNRFESRKKPRPQQQKELICLCSQVVDDV